MATKPRSYCVAVTVKGSSTPIYHHAVGVYPFLKAGCLNLVTYNDDGTIREDQRYLSEHLIGWRVEPIYDDTDEVISSALAKTMNGNVDPASLAKPRRGASFEAC